MNELEITKKLLLKKKLIRKLFKFEVIHNFMKKELIPYFIVILINCFLLGFLFSIPEISIGIFLKWEFWFIMMIFNFMFCGIIHIIHLLFTKELNFKDLFLVLIIWIISFTFIIFIYTFFEAFLSFFKNELYFMYKLSHWFQILIASFFIFISFWNYLIYTLDKGKDLINHNKNVLFLIIDYITIILLTSIFGFFDLSTPYFNIITFAKISVLNFALIMLLPLIIWGVYKFFKIFKSFSIEVDVNKIYFKFLIIIILLIFSFSIVQIEKDKEVFDLKLVDSENYLTFNCNLNLADNYYVIDSEIKCKFYERFELSELNKSLNLTKINITYQNVLNSNYKGSIYFKNFSNEFIFITPKQTGYYDINLALDNYTFLSKPIFLYDWERFLEKNEELENRIFTYLVTAILVSYAFIQIYFNIRRKDISK